MTENTKDRTASDSPNDVDFRPQKQTPYFTVCVEVRDTVAERVRERLLDAGEPVPVDVSMPHQRVLHAQFVRVQGSALTLMFSDHDDLRAFLLGDDPRNFDEDDQEETR